MKNILILLLSVSTLLLACKTDNKFEEKDKNSLSDNPTRYEDFILKDYNKVEHSLKQYEKADAIVLMFISVQCPVSNAYNSRMVDLYQNFKDSNIVFLGINSNKEESVEEIKSHAEENGFGFPVLKDWNNIIADRFNAAVTPEIYVLNNKFELEYEGRIDDSRRIEDVESHDLLNTLKAMLSDKEISVKETKAFGCSIKRN